MVDYIVENFDEDETRKLIMMYVNLAEFLGDDRYAQLADTLIRRLVDNLEKIKR